MNRKLNPPGEMLPTPKFKFPITRARTNSAPVPYVPPVTPAPLPQSSLANASNITNNNTSSLSPSGSNEGNVTSSGGGNGNSSNESSPPTSPTSPLANNPPSPMAIHNRLLIKRRNSSASPPVNILTPSARFQKMKLENITTVSASPIIGSSPKRSWFSSFFSKADKQEEESTNKHKEGFGFSSAKTITEINSELQRVFKDLDITLSETVPNQSYSARFSLPKSPSIKFTVEILNINGKGPKEIFPPSATPANSYFVNFLQNSGNPDDCILLYFINIHCILSLIL